MTSTVDEYDGKLGVFRLDRPLYSPMHYPGDYGFIPGTLAEDGDPLDVLTLVEEAGFTGCMIEVRPVGLLDLVDQKEPDQKILAKRTRMRGWQGAGEAFETIRHSRDRYLARHASQ